MSSRSLSLSGLALGAGLVIAGCSALVSSELTNVGCTQEGAIGPPACPVGQSCRKGQCTSCAPKDLCGNGIDDDCNDPVDDRCPGDAGGAGGAGGSGVGGSGAFPAGAGGVSGGGMGGALGGAGGVAGGGTGGSGGSGGAIDPIGAPCGAGDVCPSGLFCTNANQHGTAIDQKICTKGCCASPDCGTGTAVCYGANTGYSLCMPAAYLGLPNPGSKSVAAACGADGECRSALCDNGKCADTCCYHNECNENNPDCKALSVKTSPLISFHCSSGGGKSPGAWCGSNSECRSGVCEYIQAAGGFICLSQCCKKNDCTTNWACNYLVGTNFGTRVCMYAGAPGPKLLGETCAADSECKSRHCFPFAAGSRCSDTCCEDADCGDTSKFACLPEPSASSGSPLLICKTIF